MLNLSPDHLDRHGSLAAYTQAKQRIFRGDGWQVINADDPAVTAMVEPGRQVLRFTLAEPAPGEFGLHRRAGELWLAHGADCWLAAGELQISGAHNLANALAALSMGHALGLERNAMLAALRAFTGLPHRTRLVLERDGVRWYDDSKGTNVGATVAAVNGLPGRLVLIAGGDGKGQDFTPLKTAVAARARAVVLIGRDREKIAQAIEGSGASTQRARDMEEAVRMALAAAREGDAVLLSPACASFDMFRNYEHRAQVFVQAVKDLAVTK